MIRIIAVMLLFLTNMPVMAAVSDSDLQSLIESGDKRGLIKALDSGVDVNLKIGKQQRPLVQVAIIKEQEKIVKELIQRGADPNAKDSEGKTTLHHAALARSGSIINFLASHGADPGIKDNKGKYPLDIAKEAGKSNNVMVLSVAAMMAGQKNSQNKAPSTISPEQQQMMKMFLGKLQQHSAPPAKEKKPPDLSKQELSKILVGQWVNPKENHIITFNKNGMFEGARDKNMKWKAVSGNGVYFTENKVAGFGFGKNATVEYKNDKLYFSKSDIVRGEYQRATDALVAQVKAKQRKRQEYLTRSLDGEKSQNVAMAESGSAFVTERNCNHCVIVPNGAILSHGELFDWSIAQNSDFSQAQNVIWQNLNFNWSDFHGSTFAGTKVNKTRFFHADLRNVDFSNTALQDVNFAYADLSGANFRNAVIVRTMFTGANLTNADFTGAKIQASDFTFSNQAGWKFDAKTDESVKIVTTGQDRMLAGLWIVKRKTHRPPYLHIFSNGVRIVSDARGKVLDRETFIFTEGNRIKYRSSEDSSAFSPGDTKITFTVDKNTLRISDGQGKTSEYVRASDADFKKYKIGIYRNSFFEMAKNKQIVFFKELLDNGLSIKESRDNRAPRLTWAVLLGDTKYDDQRATTHLMKLLVDHGMDYQTHIKDRIPVAEAAARGQLEALKYLLSVDKREDVVDAALRQLKGAGSDEAIAILKHAKAGG